MSIISAYLILFDSDILNLNFPQIKHNKFKIGKNFKIQLLTQ